MCFSATGSFAAAGVLGGIGAVSIARHRSAPYVMLAALPLVFAVQQGAEGLVWMTIRDQVPGHLNQFAVYAFLVAALVIWPIWIPVALFRVEAQLKRQTRLKILVWVGLAVSAYSVALLIRGEPRAHVAGHSIGYDYQSIGFWAGGMYLLVYVTATVLPFFLSHLNFAKWLGAAFLVGLSGSMFMRFGALTSVWCFVSAILSGLLVASMDITRRRMDAAEPLAPVASDGWGSESVMSTLACFEE